MADFINSEEDRRTEILLKQIIDREGLKYLDENSYAVYEELIKSKAADACTSRLILITLLAGVSKKKSKNKAALSEFIQEECCLQESASDRLAALYASLFSPENRREWRDKKGSGFREFCENIWEFELETKAVWSPGSVYMNAYFEVKAELQVGDSDILHRELKTLLTKNPFTTAEAIYSYIEKELQKELDADFEEYVTEDDYYPPVAEDYDGNFDDLIEKFCKRYGLEVESCECDGSTSDFESDRW